VYRGLKPVHWSVANETALAEAELEYEDREDLSVYVDFEAADAAKVYDAFGLPARSGRRRRREESPTKRRPRSTESRRPDDRSREKLAPKPGTRPLTRPSFMIWTTTPWTLPANLAIAVNPRFSTRCVWVDGAVTVMAADALVEKRHEDGQERAAVGEFVVLATTAGEKLVGLRYRTRSSPAKTARPAFRARQTVRDDAPFHTIVPADYVTLEDGTGLVHTAPGHGTEDYQTGLRQAPAPLLPRPRERHLRRHRPRVAPRPLHLEGQRRRRTAPQ
jgi:isoleucyl-tRNA synthetase